MVKVNLDKLFLTQQEAEREAPRVLAIQAQTGLSAKALQALLVAMKGGI